MHDDAASSLRGTVEKIIKPIIQGEAELNSTCGWHRKTQDGQIKLIEEWRAGGLQPAWEIHDEGSGPE